MNGVYSLSNPSGDRFSDYQTGNGARRRLASYINWKGDVSGVRKQGKGCAGAWAFAIAAMSEASVELKEGDRYDFAEQYLLECSSMSSCSGGFLEYAQRVTINDGGLPKESAYPYDPDTDYSGICSGGNTKTYVAQYSYNFYGLSDNQLIELLQNGPVAVKVSA